MYFSFLDVFKSVWEVSSFPSLLCLGVEWNLGFVLVVLYLCQVLSGVWLSFFYETGVEVEWNGNGVKGSYYSMSFIIKEVDFGWLVFYLHMIVPGFIFFIMIFHIMNGLVYSVYVFFSVWVSGCIVYFLFVVVSFTGYGLVFGSLGFWAIMVVVGLLDYVFGSTVSMLLFSSSTVSHLILLNIYSYHFILSLGLSLFIYLHIYMVHNKGGSSFGVYSSFLDYCEFSSLSWNNDFYVLIGVLGFLLISVCFYPEGFFGCDNFTELVMFSVPEEINPEWYLSVIFIILKSIDSNGLGVCLVSLCFVIGVFKVYFSGSLGEVFFSSVLFYCFIFLGGLLVGCSLLGSICFYIVVVFLLIVILDYSLVSVSSLSFNSYKDFSGGFGVGSESNEGCW